MSRDQVVARRVHVEERSADEGVSVKTKEKNLSVGSSAKRKVSGVAERREKKGESVKVGCDAVAAHAEVNGDWRMWGEIVMKSGANDEVP